MSAVMRVFPNAPSRSRAAPRCLRKSAISGSERIGDPRSTEELRSSGMTKDGSASRLSNHAPVSSLLTSLLPLTSSRGLSRWARSASLRERSAPFEVPARRRVTGRLSRTETRRPEPESDKPTVVHLGALSTMRRSSSSSTSDGTHRRSASSRPVGSWTAWAVRTRTSGSSRSRGRTGRVARPDGHGRAPGGEAHSDCCNCLTGATATPSCGRSGNDLQ